jgi:hypothetical protein
LCAGTATRKSKNRLWRDFKRIKREDLSPEETTELLRGLVSALIDKNLGPGFMIDQGHYFGADLRDADKMGAHRVYLDVVTPDSPSVSPPPAGGDRTVA